MLENLEQEFHKVRELGQRSIH